MKHGSRRITIKSDVPQLPRRQRLRRALLSVFFQRLYTNLAWLYDLVAWLTSVGLWRQWQQAALEALPPDGALLEVGHGPGHLLRQLGSDGRRVFGADRSRQMNRLAVRRLQRAALPSRVAQIAAEALPFPAGSFSSVFATFPASFILEPQALSEIHRVLSLEGRLVILPGARITGRSLLDRLARAVNRLCGQSAGSAQPWLELLAGAGFQARAEQCAQPRSVVLRLVAWKDQQAPSAP